jgi:hypothetical protein
MIPVVNKDVKFRHITFMDRVQLQIKSKSKRYLQSTVSKLFRPWQCSYCCLTHMLIILRLSLKTWFFIDESVLRHND